jgi:predicted permease
MSARRGWPERVALAAFRAAGRLLPPGFRAAYFAEAERDLRETLDTRYRRGGSVGVAAAGAAAVADVVRRVPVEWWAVLTDRADGRSPVAGPRTGEWMMIWIGDLRVAARALGHRPGYTAAAMLTLALGIGATVAIFTVVDAVLLRSLPYPDADRIVSVSHHAPALNLPELNNSDGTLNFYRDEADFFASLAAFTMTSHNLVGGNQPERVQLTAVTPSLFDVLRVRPALGRPFGEADAVDGAPPVAILTHASWTSRFGADPDVLGRTIELDGTPTEIVGVMAKGFAFPDPDPVALVPMGIDPNGTFGAFGTEGIGRLAPGLTVEQAQRRATELQARLYEYFPDLTPGFVDQSGWSVTVQRYQDRLVGRDVASALWIVLGTVGFVLLIACANVANLFLVRAESRQKELAVRAAMGAGSGRIASGFLSEAFLLGAAGGAAGLLLAWLGVDVLVERGPSSVPRLDQVAVGGASVAFAVVLSLAASLLLGALPLVRYRASALASILRDGGRGATDGRGRHRTRSLLVAAQLSLALVLLVGSGLMLRSFDRLRRVDPGFDPADVLVIGMSLGENFAGRSPEGARFYQGVADEVATLPGVRAVGLTSRAPLGEGDSNGGSFYIEGEPRDESELPPVAMYKAVGADYLAAIGQPLLGGRDLQPSDWEEATPVLLVNRAFEETFLGGAALGKGIKWDSARAFARVVGVVEDAHEFRLTEEPRPVAYLPMVVGDWGYPGMARMYLTVRGDGHAPLPLAAIRDVVRRQGPEVPITTVRTMDEIMARSIAQMSFTMVLLGLAAVVALFLGAVGLFAVVSYVVGQRTREIGVRVALGAARADIRRMVFRQSAVVAAAGVVVGLLGAGALTRFMDAILYEVDAADPLTFVGAPLLLVAVLAFATWLPARRAARVDPIDALRAE